MAQGKKEEAEAVKAQVSADAAKLAELEASEKELNEKVNKIMMTIPNIIDPSVPIGKDDSENVEIEKFGEPVVPDFEIIIQILWKDSMESIWMQLVRLLVMVFITLWEILQDFIQQLSHMQEIS